jgi:HEAT repeat protein
MSMAVALSMVYLDRCPAGGQTPAKPAGTQAEPQSDPDGVVGVDLGQGTPLSNKDRAWSILTNAMNDHKHAEIRIQALAALGSMGGDPRAIQMILDTFNDPDVDLRTAAVLAAGQTKSPLVTTDLRRMLDDKEPPVAFAAATALWKMNDRSGEDILVAVVDGERPAGDGLVSGTMHTMSRDLHNPGEMARLGAMQGASMLLGPFGMGITALEYMRKNGGDAARVSAVEEIAENHTAPIRGKLIAALGDKDVGVRTAAAKALGSYHEPDVAPALVNDFEDAKAPVRLTSAASFLLSTGAVAAAPSAKQEHAKARARARRRS